MPLYAVKYAPSECFLQIPLESLKHRFTYIVKSSSRCNVQNPSFNQNTFALPLKLAYTQEKFYLFAITNEENCKNVLKQSDF